FPCCFPSRGFLLSLSRRYKLHITLKDATRVHSPCSVYSFKHLYLDSQMSKKFAVDFYFDILSPYSFLMFETLLSRRSKWPMEVTLKPFALQHIFKATRNTSPGLASPAKAVYSAMDLERAARYNNIPLRVRYDFIEIIQTKSSLNANRLICAVQQAEPDKAESVARSLYHRLWIEGGDVFDNNSFEEVLDSCGVNNASTLISSLSTERVKDMVKRNTEEALKTGCFGAPWTVMTHQNGTTEAFFGSDRLHIIGHLMGQPFEEPLTSRI
ncbi:gstk-2, partial [Pristionchus pacificus]